MTKHPKRPKLSIVQGGRAVGYVRRSVARRGDPGDVSREMQIEAVRRLAGLDGPGLRILAGDWGISADREQTYRRLDFLELIAAVERAEIDTIYAFALDRLARSVQWSARLLDACEDAGARIVTGEGTFDPASDRDRQMVHFFAMQNEGALRGMKTKARAASATRAARGDVGPRAYGETRTRRDGVVVGAGEDVELVLAAFREAGSYNGAARILNDRGIEPMHAGRLWFARGVARVVNRADPSTAPLGHRKGTRTVGSRLFAGLLRCHCGAILGQTMSAESVVKYRCPRGAIVADHGPSVVSERKLREPIAAEAALLELPFDQVELAEVDAAARARLEAKRERIVDMFADGTIKTKSQRDARLAAIEIELEGLDAARIVVELPESIDWTRDPADVNRLLRAIFERIELGADLLPLEGGYRWRVPAWRRADPSPAALDLAE